MLCPPLSPKLQSLLLNILPSPSCSQEERQKRRIHSIVPWIRNPLQGVDKENLVFSPRHEASTLELFFDLFFVANLATFTTYHGVTDHSSLFAYMGFFAIIWATWYHTALYDVRFENDSIYSRVCKTIMMTVFVGFALVGSAFAPGTERGDNTSFRILCYSLVVSRLLFAVQYLVVGFFVGLARRTDLYLPVLLNALVYMVAAAAFGGMIPHFARGKPVDEGNAIYSVWWIVMAVESIAVIAISSVWRMLSFKKTHLVERMGLLTLIVIGEGAIGVTKTISRMMGKHGFDPEGSVMVLCIVLILVGLWMMYFDNHPNGHFGTIKQQIWSLLHFPMHLAIVGLVEGAQQVALARYMSVSSLSFERALVKYCFIDHLDGEELVAKLRASLDYLELEKKLGGLIYLDELTFDLQTIGQTVGICQEGVHGTTSADLPEELNVIWYRAMNALYSSLGLSLPPDQAPLAVMFESWRLVYRYFWGSFVTLMICFLAAMFLIRRNRIDAYHLVSFSNRSIVIVVGAAVLGISATTEIMNSIMEQPIILPVAVGLIYGIILSDRLGKLIANHRNRESGDPLTRGFEHGHHNGARAKEHDGENQPLTGEDKTKGTSIVVTGTPRPGSPHLSQRTSYNPLGGGSVMPSYNGRHNTWSHSSASSSNSLRPQNLSQPTRYMPVQGGRE
ncbi:bacterial low temperature requirement A protein-domain-containing protein [Cladorrhinum sp. PSN332]|nr:bacterial low temperature requirement A protein-domain-containing protein [Cladorrhinum sp. PSN332]